MNQSAKIGVFLLAFTVAFAFAQNSLVERVSSLEERVSQLEALLETQPAPASRTSIGNFTIARVSVSQATPTYMDVVGEISSPDGYEYVEMRVTAYGSDGSILGTTTFPIENVGSAPRTFDTSLRDVTADEVDSLGWQVERTR